jgi:hypothetical protein
VFATGSFCAKVLSLEGKGPRLPHCIVRDDSSIFPDRHRRCSKISSINLLAGLAIGSFGARVPRIQAWIEGRGLALLRRFRCRCRPKLSASTDCRTPLKFSGQRAHQAERRASRFGRRQHRMARWGHCRLSRVLPETVPRQFGHQRLLACSWQEDCDAPRRPHRRSN